MVGMGNDTISNTIHNNWKCYIVICGTSIQFPGNNLLGDRLMVWNI